MKTARRAVVVLLLAGATPTQEPEADRVAGLVLDLSKANRMTAAAELYHMGAAAVPEIARRLEAGWQEDDDGDAAFRAALRVLEYLGPEAIPACDTLVASLQDHADTGLRNAIFAVLGRTAPYDHDRALQVSKALGDQCDKGNYFGSTGFFEALSRLDYDAGVDVPGLVNGLTHQNPYARELAAEALARRADEIRADAKLKGEVVKALREAVENEHPDDFQVEWLWNGGMATTHGGASNQERIRDAAAMALSLLEPDDPLAVPGLRRRLQHVDPRVQVEAARALGALGEIAADAVEDLARMLTEAHPLAAREAATALGMLGAAAKAAVPDLETAAESDDAQLAARAKAALRQIRD